MKLSLLFLFGLVSFQSPTRAIVKYKISDRAEFAINNPEKYQAEKVERLKKQQDDMKKKLRE